MRERRCLLLALYGLLLATAVAGALKATRPKFKIATTSTTTTTTEEPEAADNEDSETTTPSSDVNATTARVLTGIPQIDYIWDPNLPRELNGFNLSDYPFYNSIPPNEEIDFKCDGLHDGFYASVPHKCQVYHHCLYGTRYDFLCANFTAFDQKTFICHFASEVDCANSKKYWHRNDALYKAAETTTTSTTTTSTTTTTTTAQPHAQRPRPGPRGRRPFRRRPAYDYYDEEYYDDDVGYERTRPRGYDRRDDYDYDDRKYTRRDRDREREFRDRDYRDRDLPRSREPDRPLRDPERPLKDDREAPPLSPRERFPSRSSHRDAARPSSGFPRDPVVDEEPRNRNRDPEVPIRSREPEDTLDDRRPLDSRNRNRDPEVPIRSREPEDPLDDRRPLDSRNRNVDDRRYNDKGSRDDYEDEPAPSGPGSSSGPPEVLVKPAAPASSVYARPRAPPKIRRPVPVSKQDKFAYKGTSSASTADDRPLGGEARRGPAKVAVEDDYYDDEIEEVRPRRPVTRRRPGFRDFYESPRERDRERPYRPRYRDDEEVVRPRKHPERNRERYYERGPERGRDRSLDRTKDRLPEPPRRLPEAERPERPIGSHNRDADRSRPVESTRRPNIYDRTSVAPPTTSTTSTSTEAPIEEPTERPYRTQNHQNPTTRNHQKSEVQSPRQNPAASSSDAPQHDNPEDEEPERKETPLHHDNAEKDINKQRNEQEEYSSSDEYYDEADYQPASSPPPRTAVRVVKRPFLPSRGGNPNPRGLSPVGAKATDSSRREETQSNRSGQVHNSPNHSDAYLDVKDDRKSSSEDDKRPYDAYKYVQTDGSQKTRSEEYEDVITRPGIRRPEEEDRSHDDGNNSGAAALPRNPIRGRNDDDVNDKKVLKWNSDEFRLGQRGDVRHEPETSQGSNAGTSQNRPKARVPVTENSGYYTDSYSNGNNDQPISPAGSNKPIINEVVTHHRLQDIPESEYDVTLNEALTPSFSNQDANLPSGFVLPIHRQLGRDTILQSTENSYKVSRPYNQQVQPSQGQQQPQQQQQQQQQKAFVPSPQFLPLTGIGSGNGNERSRSVQYFRTPEAVHVTGTQYRHQRGPWHDYTGY